MSHLNIAAVSIHAVCKNRRRAKSYKIHNFPLLSKRKRYEPNNTEVKLYAVPIPTESPSQSIRIRPERAAYRIRHMEIQDKDTDTGREGERERGRGGPSSLQALLFSSMELQARIEQLQSLPVFTWVPFEEDSRFGSDTNGERAALRQTASAAIFAIFVDIEMIKNEGNKIEQKHGKQREAFKI